MKRANFTLDEETLNLLDEVSERFYGGNKSKAIRAAIESLASHTGHAGWVVDGYTPVALTEPAECHTCHTPYKPGDTLYRPVFKRGVAKGALQHLPHQAWLDCETCADEEAA